MSLIESDRASNGKPTFSAEQRPVADAWLRRILVDAGSLDRHISLLQEQYGSPFRYSRPRRDRLILENKPIPAEGSKFTHTGLLPDDRVTAVLDQGVDALSGDEVAWLLTNPYGLCDLYDVIDEVQPDRWLEEFEGIAAELVSETPLGESTAAAGASPVLAETLPSLPLSVSPPEPELWTRLPDLIAEAVAKSVLATKTVEPSSNEGRMSAGSRWLTAFAVAASVACVVSIAAFWVAVQTGNSERAALSQLLASQQQKGAGSHEPSNQSPELMSAPGSDLDLLQLMKAGLLNLKSAKADPGKQLKQIQACASPDIRALIAFWQEQNHDAFTIISDLRSLSEKEPKTP